MIIEGVLFNIQTKPIFFRSYDKEFSPSGELLGGFLAALNIFAKNISQDQISVVITGKMKYYNYLINKKDDLNLIIITDQSTSASDLKKIMETVKDKFLKKYSIQEILANMSQPSYFDDFKLLIDSLIQKINQSNIDEADSEIAEELLIVPPDEKSPLDLSNTSLPFVFKFVKDLGKVIYALFIRMRVVVTGELSLVKLIINTLKLFSPHHTLKSIYWTENPNESNANILGVPPKLVDLNLDSTIVNLEKNIVDGLKENKYFEDLVKSIKKMEDPKILPYVREKVNFLNEKARDLATLINSRKISDTDINNFNKDIDTDILKILETYFYWNYPKYTKKIIKIFGKARSLLLAREFL